MRSNILRYYGVKGYNMPKRTPEHPTKSHIVVAKQGNIVKVIRFGQQGVKGAGSHPRTKREQMRRRLFKLRHRNNILKGKLYPAYWSNLVKW